VPEAKRDIAIQGKLDAYIAERALMEQPFVKNGDVTIRELIDQAVQKFGEKVEVTRFARFSVK
jgi:elongation factor Ts